MSFTNPPEVETQTPDLAERAQQYETARSAFDTRLASTRSLFGVTIGETALLAARTDLVRAAEGLLDEAYYVEVTGDFYFQDWQSPHDPGDRGVHAEKMRIAADRLWVGPYNRQTEGYAELSGGIMTHKSHGNIPMLAWSGEPRYRPGYPLVASMVETDLVPIDDVAKDYPITNRFGLTRTNDTNTWNRVMDSTPEELRDLVSETVPMLVDEGKIVPMPEEDRLHGVFTHHMPHAKGWLDIDADGLLARMEFGWSPNTLTSERYDFVTSGRNVILAYTPNTSHLNRPGIYSSTHRRAHFLTESDEASSVTRAASNLVRTFEIASMTSGDFKAQISPLE